MNCESLYERLEAAGYPVEKMYHWCSDLYVDVTPTTKKVILEWCEENDFDPDVACPMFVDAITGRLMFDCGFQYTPYWDGYEE